MDTRTLSNDDVESIWSINEQGLPGTGQVSKQELRDLLEISDFSLGAFKEEELLGFVLCLSPGTTYGSPNYAWFNDHFDAFVYVDRIAVSKDKRNQGIGTLLYQRVVSYAQENSIPVAAEVNLNPPNPGSMRFHHRFRFEEVGIVHHKEKSVTMLMRNTTKSP
tara:strand:+ start:1141 stop:1629 length:489 start_codon:yes stop_codon:yes gene_type:complete